MMMALAAMTLSANAQGSYSVGKRTMVSYTKAIKDVKNIEILLDRNGANDWKLGGSGNDETTVADVDLSGKYLTSAGTNGAPILITTKKVFMKDGDTKIDGKVLSTGAEQLCGQHPAADIRAWDGLVYEVEADKTYTFYISGAKWRFAGFKFE